MIAYHSLREAFLQKGFRSGSYFDHDAVELGKRYPDTLLLLDRRGFAQAEAETGKFLQINLYARDVGEFPDELFFDGEINWHKQHFGRKGLVAAAGLFMIASGDVFVTLIQSDLMQQIHRSAGALKRFKSRLENRFGSWPDLMPYAVLNSAWRRGVQTLYVPTSQTIIACLNTRVDPRLFERIYDIPVRALATDQCVIKGHAYWRIDVAASSAGLAGLYTNEICEPDTRPWSRPTVCVLHDVEGDFDVQVPAPICERNLERTLVAERSRGIRGTYNIVGKLLETFKHRIAGDGHEIGFHSYNHDITDLRQLPQARSVDLQVKGYRPPQSVITPELSPYNLSYWNFEWLASSRYGLGRDNCYVDHGIAVIPIDIDDYPLHTGEFGFERWLNHILGRIRDREIYAFSLHDCYAENWIDHYPALLDAISRIAEFRTCDDVAGRLFLRATDFSATMSMQTTGSHDGG